MRPVEGSLLSCDHTYVYNLIDNKTNQNPIDLQ